MALAEFELIQRFFASNACRQPTTRLGVGDDCALLSIPPGYQLAVTADTMVENVHFLPTAEPEALGHKLLAVNLSDLASMGAEPVAVTLALTMPKTDDVWLERFAEGFLALANAYRVDLVGGDTTAGPLTLTVQAMGLIPEGRALLRSTAKAGDLIYMSGMLGEAGLGLKIEQGYRCPDPEPAVNRFNRPEPRIQEGVALRNVASSCIDISDGLAQDLGHILKQSRVGACLDWEKLPLSNAVRNYVDETGDWAFPLRAGDDYELCFTVPPGKADLLSGTFTCIGQIESEPGLRLKRFETLELLAVKGFEHFS